MNPAPRISDAEWQVMKVLWQSPGISAQEMIARLEGSTDWTAATIKTLLNRLLKKGVIRFEKEGKAYTYFPVAEEAECQRQQAEGLLERIFDGALSPLLAQLIGTRRLSKRELEELEELVRVQREQNRRQTK